MSQTNEGELRNRFYYTLEREDGPAVVHDRIGALATSGHGTRMCGGISVHTAERIVEALNRDDKLRANARESDRALKKRTQTYGTQPR